MSHHNSSFVTLFILAVAAVGAVAADQPAAPQDSKQTVTAPASHAAPKATPAGASQPASSRGVVVFVDPATGQIRQPDASEIGGLAPSATGPAPRAAEPALIQGPGGAVGARLGADSMTYMVVTATPDGKLAMDCVTGEKAAADRVAPKAAPQPAAPKAKDSQNRQDGTHDVKAPR